MSRPPDQNHLLEKCGEVLGVPGLKLTDDFYGVGGDSFDAVEICELLSKELGRDIEMATVLRSRSFGEMLTAVTG